MPSRVEDVNVPPTCTDSVPCLATSRDHAIRVNDQYRVVFRFEGADAYDVRCPQRAH